MLLLFFLCLFNSEQDHTALSGKRCGVRLWNACQIVSLGLLFFFSFFLLNRIINFKCIYKERKNNADFCSPLFLISRLLGLKKCFVLASVKRNTELISWWLLFSFFCSFSKLFLLLINFWKTDFFLKCFIDSNADSMLSCRSLRLQVERHGVKCFLVQTPLLGKDFFFPDLTACLSTTI